MLRRTGLIALLMVVSLPVNAETDDIKEWHKQIHTQLMSNSRFPRAARGQTGTAKVGFVLEGVRRQAVRHEGAWHDVHDMAIVEGDPRP